MRQAPMLRVRYAKAFATALRTSGYDADELLRRVRLDSDVLETPEAWIPMSQLCQVLEAAADLRDLLLAILSAGALHQLQIVDDDEPETGPTAHPTGLRPDLGHGEAG